MSILASLVSPISDILEKAVPDKDLKAKLSHEIATLADKQSHEINLAQIELNKIEATGNWMQKSWRPLIGMTCAIAFFWHFVLQPFLTFGLSLAGIDVPLISFDMNSLLTVLGGLLGLGTLRTVEKHKGLTK